ncbi:transposase [Flavobacterium sp. ACAM 123]|uniref:transposase n=1 Tax=Flavobacterium sp. ACAM 123 TaxID=1189620 RepID=UPI000377B73B|nr:transposase [Flavobacterium sp. ACAM 123]
MWEQYITINPDGYRSSQFTHHYKVWSKRVNPVMYINHKAGDKMYVNYAGKTLSIVYKDTGEIKDVQFFVAILGASQDIIPKDLCKPKRNQILLSGRIKPTDMGFIRLS